MRSFLFLAFALLPAAALRAAPGVEITLSGLSMPVFSPAGELTHRIVARDGTKTGAVQVLRGVEVQSLAPGDPTRVLHTLTTDEAQWDEKKGTLVGRGRVNLVTPESRVAGEGFDFTLATSLLHVHRDFSLRNDELLLTSDRATVEAGMQKAGNGVKFRDIRRCEAVGHLEITVQPSAVGTYLFEKASSERAIYDGEQRTIDLPEPTRTFGPRGTATAKTMRVRLEPRKKEAVSGR